MDEMVRQAFLQAAGLVDKASERVIESARQSVANAETFTRIASDVSEALLRAAGETRPQDAGTETTGTQRNAERLFTYIYENENVREFKDALLKQKPWLLNNLDILQSLYKQASEAEGTNREKPDGFFGFTDNI